MFLWVSGCLMTQSVALGTLSLCSLRCYVSGWVGRLSLGRFTGKAQTLQTRERGHQGQVHRARPPTHAIPALTVILR